MQERIVFCFGIVIFTLAMCFKMAFSSQTIEQQTIPEEPPLIDKNLLRQARETSAAMDSLLSLLENDRIQIYSTSKP